MGKYSQSEYREAHFRMLTQWLTLCGAPGLDFLTNQMVLTKNTGAKLTILGSFRNLGTNAGRVLPAVVQVIKEVGPFPPAVRVLADAHAQPQLTIPVLFRAATNGNVTAVAALGEWGTNAAPWLSGLLPLTTNSDPQISFQAGIAVRKIQGK